MDDRLQRHTLHNGKTLVIFGRDNAEIIHAFARIQEYYESKDFKDVIVDNLEEIIDSYKNIYDIDYMNNWDGFNIPKTIVFDFVKKCKVLNRHEKLLVRLLKSMNSVEYVIAYVTKKSDAILHEIAHSMYYHDSEYRDKVNSEIGKYNTKKIDKILSERGKHESVYLNEINAHAISGMDDLFSNWFDSLQWLFYYKWYYCNMIKNLEKTYNHYMLRNQ